MIKFKHKGNFKNLERFLSRMSNKEEFKTLDRFGQAGVEALRAATPVQSGETASLWGYEIQNDGATVKIVWTNENINQGVNIAVIIQYGHGTGTGGYVQGRDYINPALRSVFDNIANEVWKEVTSK